jgi:RNA polymerase sigma-70 factor (ECF subfamily)
MNDFALTRNAVCQTTAEADEEAFQMDDERFRALYERTARRLWAYLYRITGDSSASDDLVQETYYRFLRARLPEMNEAHCKSYLFRIATNLVHDKWRKNEPVVTSIVTSDGLETVAAGSSVVEQFEHRAELTRAFQGLKPRERELLWLAYVEGSSHKEIAQVSGLRTNSIRPMLHRARRKLAGILRGVKT